jgi:hypothetical protein
LFDPSVGDLFPGSGMPDGTIPPFGDRLRVLYIDICGEAAPHMLDSLAARNRVSR